MLQPHGSAVKDSSSAAKVVVKEGAAAGLAEATVAGPLTVGAGRVGVGTEVTSGVGGGQATAGVGGGTVALEVAVLTEVAGPAVVD